MKRLFSVLFIISILLCAGFVNAEEGDISYESPEGVELNFHEDGRLKSVKASAEVTLEFGDREDINLSKREAKMIAKAEIAKFLKEKLGTMETLNKVTKTVTAKTKGQDSTATREQIKIQMVQIHNSADAYLKGVVTLLEDVNKDKNYVRVEVGMNEKTMAVADTMRRRINEDNSSTTSNRSGSAESSGREIRKSKMYDDF